MATQYDKPLYIVSGHDDDLWGYDDVCVGSLSKCVQFVNDSPYSFDDEFLNDRIAFVKNNIWGILDDESDIHAGFLTRVYPNTSEWVTARKWLKEMDS